MNRLLIFLIAVLMLLVMNGPVFAQSCVQCHTADIVFSPDNPLATVQEDSAIGLHSVLADMLDSVNDGQYIIEENNTESMVVNVPTQDNSAVGLINNRGTVIGMTRDNEIADFFTTQEGSANIPVFLVAMNLA